MRPRFVITKDTERRNIHLLSIGYPFRVYLRTG